MRTFVLFMNGEMKLLFCIIWFWFARLTHCDYLLSSSNCPVSCSCYYIDYYNLLRISCSQANIPFILPSNFTQDPVLASVKSIEATNCLIQNIPSNICQYQNLISLDLSNNQIQSIQKSSFNCNKLFNSVIINYYQSKTIHLVI